MRDFGTEALLAAGELTIEDCEAMDALVVPARDDPREDFECRATGEHAARLDLDHPEAGYYCERCGVLIGKTVHSDAFVMATVIAMNGIPVSPRQAKQLNRVLRQGRAFYRYGRRPEAEPEYVRHPQLATPDFPVKQIISLIESNETTWDGEPMWKPTDA